MRFSVILACVLLTSSACERPEIRHDLSSLQLKPGNPASIDVFGRVVPGERDQSVHFETGVVPIPLVQTTEKIVNLDRLKQHSFSEHAGRAASGYIKARTVNITQSNSAAERYDNISLTNLDRTRRVRTAIAQFPSLIDFKSAGYSHAVFGVSEKTDVSAVFYKKDSPDIRIFEDAIGRPLRFPVLINTEYLIENYK